MALNIDLAWPIATKILDLEKRRFSVFIKLAAKTTSGSGFLVIFVFSTLELVENANKLKNVPRHFFEKFGVKVRKIEKLFKRVTKISHS